MTRAGLVAAALAAVLLFGACGKPPEDKAHDDGEKVGTAVRQLFDSRSVDDAKAALSDLRKAVGSVGDDVKGSVRTQLQTQRDTLTQAVQQLRQGDVSGAKDQAQAIRAQADAFSHTRDSVSNEFWRGFEEGYDG